MRIVVDTGGLTAPTFGAVAEAIGATSGQVGGSLTSAAGAAGAATVMSAVSNLADVLSIANPSAELVLTALETAVVRAGERYSANESRIAKAASG
jgi:hypothetical protein